MRKLLVILGVPIDDLTMPAALDRIGAFIAAWRQDGRMRQIATVNADFVTKSYEDPELLDILQNADMLTADGMPLVWGARLLGIDLAGRVTGADMVPALAERAAAEGWSLYFLGAAPGVAAAAADVLRAQYPGLTIAGIYSPPVSSVFEMDPAIVERINESQADVLLVAFGNPKQEKWINMHRNELRCAVAMGVGGTFDFIAGRTRRAPDWMQRAGLEWLFRLVQEPKRLWKRYVTDLFGFGYFFLWQWWHNRRGVDRETVLPRSELVLAEGVAILSVQGRLDLNNRGRLVDLGQQALAQRDETAQAPQLLIDLSAATFVDSAGLGALVQLHKLAREAGSGMRLANVPPAVLRTIRAARLDSLFDIDRAEGEQVALKKAPEPVRLWDGAVVVVMPERVDVTTLVAVQTLLEQALLQSAQMVLDLTQTRHIDSAGLSLLLGIKRQVGQAGGYFKLAAPSDVVRQVLAVSRLDTVFDLYPTVEQAIKEE